MKLYICYTVYHLYATLLRYNDTNIPIGIVLAGNFPDCDNIKERLNDIYANIKVYTCDYKMDEYLSRVKMCGKNFLLRYYLIKKLIQKECNLSFLENKDIYIYNDSSFLGQYLNLIRMKYVLIEDGRDCYKKEGYKVYLESKVVFLLRSLTGVGPLYFGDSLYMKWLEVNDKQGVSIRRKVNIVEVSNDKLLDQLSEKDKEKIIKVFLDSKSEQQLMSMKGEYNLLMTQPLWQDQYLISEKEQADLYADLCGADLNGIVIKPHPRDNTNYKQYYHNIACILNKNVPVEIYSLLKDVKFKNVYTLDTTALDTINFAEKTIVKGFVYEKKL